MSGYQWRRLQLVPVISCWVSPTPAVWWTLLEDICRLCYVPQGSVLGPMLSCTPLIYLLIRRQGLQPHLFADVTHIVDSSRPRSVYKTTLHHQVELCVADITDWISSNRLQHNASKSDVVKFIESSSLHSEWHLIVDSDVIVPVRDLGLHLNTTM